MVTALVARSGHALATLLVVLLTCFFLLHAMPGDPSDRLDAPGVPAEQSERNRRALGLDRPLVSQLARTIASYATGDLGVSTLRHRPVSEVLAGALPATALLGGAALLAAYGLGVPLALGLIAIPRRRQRWIERLLIGVAVIPRFWLGVMLILLLHGIAGWLPASHAFSPGGGDWIDRLRHLVLPALTLGLPAACVVARYLLAAMQQVLADPHVRAARAAGGGGVRLLALHVLRPCLGPVVALFALDLPVLASGAVVVEVIFAWPGIGRLSADAVLGSDYPLALAAAVLVALVVVAARGLAGFLAHRLDPRQGAGGHGSGA